MQQEQHTATVIAKLLIDNFFARFGCQNESLLIKVQNSNHSYFKNFALIEKIRTTPYKPSTNGCMERFNCTLNSMLGKVVQQNQKDWDDRVQLVMAAYRGQNMSQQGSLQINWCWGEKIVPQLI